MDFTALLIYPAIFVFLFWKAKVAKKGEWNDEFLSLSQTKAIQGFCAIAILIHHVAQRTCAPWLPAKYVRHGLDMFVPIGTFFVGVFFFCSGYGLLKSYREKDNYLKGFYVRRMRPILVAFLMTWLIYFLIRYLAADQFVTGFPWFFVLQGPQMANTYAWYAAIIFFFYFVFYVAFRFLKTERRAITAVVIVVLLYMLNSDWWMFGDWWYNTVLVFPLGMIFARHEEKIIRFLKRRYWIVTPASFVIMLSTLLTSEFIKGHPNTFLSVFYEATPYLIYRWTVILLQLVSVIAFVVVVLMLNLKVQVGNPMLKFMGGMTLDFYLIHGLFVQMFSFSFFDMSPPVLYIKNVFLYTIVVLLLSLGSAYVLKKVHKAIGDFIEKFKDLIDYLVFGHWKRNLVLAAIAAVIILIVLMNNNSMRKEEVADKYEAFEKEYVTYVDVEGKRMAAYDKGEGKHTIVFLRNPGDFCPIISYKPIADRLSKENRVITLDFFGSGFSDDTDSDRTNENICREIHLALQGLGVENKVLLISHIESTNYAQAYAYLYPEEVEAIIGIDSAVPTMLTDMLRMFGTAPRDYTRAEYKKACIENRKYKMHTLTGYSYIKWPGIELQYTSGHVEEELLVMEEVYNRHYRSKNTIDEVLHEYDNFEYVKDKPFAEDLPVLYMLSFLSCGGYIYGPDYDWVAVHEAMFTNPEIQRYIVLSGDPNAVYTNAKVVADQTELYIEWLDELENDQ